MSDYRRNPRFVAIGLLLFIGGFLLVAWGLRIAYNAPDADYTGTPSCDGRPMDPGDDCLTFSTRGGADSESYEEIVARLEKNAKSNAWSGAETAGGIGAIVMLAGTGTAVHWGRLSHRATAAVTLPAVSLPLLAVAVALWPLHGRTEAKSTETIGILPLGFPYSSVLTFVVAVLGTLMIIGVPHSAKAIERAERERAPQERWNRWARYWDLEKVTLSEHEWQAELTPEEYRVLREAGTEQPFSGEYTDTTTVGVYRCRACGAELFRSETKFESQRGWPSFYAPAHPNAVTLVKERNMARTAVRCARCDSHLGQVFHGEGYPTPTDDRYSINSISLTLEPAK